MNRSSVSTQCSVLGGVVGFKSFFIVSIYVVVSSIVIDLKILNLMIYVHVKFC